MIAKQFPSYVNVAVAYIQSSENCHDCSMMHDSGIDMRQIYYQKLYSLT
jgi:hypothetical protein